MSPAGRPAKPNKIRISLKIDKDVAAAALDIAKEIGTDRSSLIEGLVVRYGPKLLSAHWKKQDKTKSRR